ncbi:diguanylate cyclase (GGDEF)-like protein [Rhizobium sp. SG_E_25_P2]|nr:diguanylate cyclase (GGDEF)-like protein [Rhizobium sp. SG_E_25_P2]
MNLLIGNPVAGGRAVLFCLLTLMALAVSTLSAFALEPVKISREDKALDLTRIAEIYANQGEAFQVSTAAGTDGIVRRIEVRASSPGHNGDWAVFALANVSDEQLERLIVAPHYRLVNSHVFWPDLGSDRILSITPSEGFALDRVASNDADVFAITLNPGAVITFVAEITSPELPQLYLWEPEAYKDTVNAFTLYRGIVLGIAGLLAVFLTNLFVIKGTSMLPATAALAWAVLGYVCVDFGFLEQLFGDNTLDERIWRAGAEVALASGLVIFLFTYLNLSRWHANLAYATLAWVLGLGTLFGVAIYDPSIASGIARLSFGLTAAAGIALIVFLGFRRYDRAILLIPSWLTIIAWLFGGWLAVTGQLDNDIVQPALAFGLVLIVLLIGFTVIQHAFAGGAYQQGLFSDLERQSLALTGSGETIWDWDVSRDRVTTIPDIALRLGATPGALHGPARNWLPRLHPDDRDRFRATLDILLAQKKGRLCHDFRLRAEDGQYHWLSIKARPVLAGNGEIARCVGVVQDVTEQKNIVERLLSDALNDNLTGLPNRQLFLDRLQSILALTGQEEKLLPTVLTIDIDRYKQVNDSLGIAAGDNILIALTRRLRRLLKPQDTLGRLAGDEFGIVLVSESDPKRIADFADAVVKAVSAPINFANQEIILTASIGVASWTDPSISAEGLLNDAELAMYRAKKSGGDRVEPFQPAFRMAVSDRLQLESDLRRAIERKELSMVYQPIVRLVDAEIVGFEALMRWDHPKRGNVPPGEFIPLAENANFIGDLGQFAIERATSDLSGWLTQTGDVPYFVSVNLSSAQLINSALTDDIRRALNRAGCPPERLKLELTETVVMENPEQSRLVLEKIRDSGIGLSLDDFGAGFSSLGYITRFPFDTIKIDQALVRDQSDKRDVLLRSIVSMGVELGMTLVAEGIESEEDAIKLGQMGCHYGQSFHFGPPIGADAVSRLLKERFPLTRKG